MTDLSGLPPPSPLAWPPPRVRRQHPQATAALVVGLISLIGVVVVVPAALGPLAAYFGATARREIERDPQRWSGHGPATAGLVLGIIASVLFALISAMMLFAAGMFALVLQFDTGY